MSLFSFKPSSDFPPPSELPKCFSEQQAPHDLASINSVISSLLSLPLGNSYLWLCKKLTPNLVAENNKHLLSHHFQSEGGMWLRWVLELRAPRGCNQNIDYSSGHLKAQLGLNPLPTHPLAYWQNSFFVSYWPHQLTGYWLKAASFTSLFFYKGSSQYGRQLH